LASKRCFRASPPGQAGHGAVERVRGERNPEHAATLAAGTAVGRGRAQVAQQAERFRAGRRQGLPPRFAQVEDQNHAVHVSANFSPTF